MDNVVNLPTNTDAALDAIVRDIAQHATDMVRGALRIGQRLIEARGILPDDAAFGAWRQQHLEPMGISLRTAQRLQNIAERFTEDTLPSVGLSVLYVLASDSVQPQMQEALIERARVGAEAGSPLTARAANTWVSKLHNGKATFVDVRRETAQIAEAAKLPPVEVPAFAGETDGNAEAGEVEVQDRRRNRDVPANLPGQPPAPRPVRDWDAEAKEYAAGIRRKIKAVPNGHRSAFLFELQQELRRAGLIEIGEGVSVTTNGKLIFAVDK